MAENPHAIIGIFGDEASEDSAGRGNSETSQNRILKNQRKMARDKIRDKLNALKFSRPKCN